MPDKNFDIPENYKETFDEMAKTYNHLDMLNTAKDEAKAALKSAVCAAVEAGDLPDAEPADFIIEVPADATHGDLASNIAMANARVYSMAPRKIAEAIVKHFPAQDVFCKTEIAGPGFINMFLGDGYYSGVIIAACTQGGDYGKTCYGHGEKINVEFVSANPTGPMHLGNARGGALGDVLAETMVWAGYDVCREYLINDAGNQILKFGKSLAVRYLQLINGEDSIEFPEDGYQGDDIKELAAEFREAKGDDIAKLDEEEISKAMIAYGLPKNIEGLKRDLAKYRIKYDVWFSEQTLHDSGAVEKIVETLRQRGAAYEKDGAVWYKATAYGAEKDEVLVRANGIPTYFAADIAYHADKFARGFTKAIDVWGADHHGHVARMKGALDAIGLDGSKLDVVLMQFVRLVRDGEPVRMSKRTGKAITLTDLLDEVPIDSARFFFNMREPGSMIEFDLDLAVREDSNNPVYYVQYAHARICSMLRNLEAEGISMDIVKAFGSLNLLCTPEERGLIRLIAAFPGEIITAAESYDPARINHYVTDVATAFHRFYNACRVKGEQEDLLQARLALCVATKIVIANCLGILKVSVPEKM